MGVVGVRRIISTPRRVSANPHNSEVVAHVRARSEAMSCGEPGGVSAKGQSGYVGCRVPADLPELRQYQYVQRCYGQHDHKPTGFQ
jgi:hypothetical protein